MRQITFVILLLLLLGCKEKTSNSSNTAKEKSVEQKVEALLSQMTLDEKIAQVCSKGIRKETSIEEGFTRSGERIFTSIKNGIGGLENTFDPRPALESASMVNQLQQFLLDSTRLRIPALIGSECLHGHAAYQSTIFPSPIAMACSWNPELVNRVFDVTGREARMRGSTEAHTPVLDLGRDPRWGRIEETYGEDSYLVSQMGYAAVSGLQGGINGQPGKDHIISSPKHFAGYAQVAGGRNFAPTAQSTRTLQDEVLPPFRKAVKEANALGIMASHCDIDGIPAHGNSWLLTDLLKLQWGFKGIVVSDYNDIQRLEIFHHVVESAQEAAKLALMAGMDLDLPAGNAYRNLKEVILAEPELEKYLDESVRRILTVKYKLGLFDDPFVDLSECEQYVGSQDNIDLALEIAHESIVLLKNEKNALPLKKENLRSIAVIGPNATSIETGVYSVKSDRVISILEGIRREVGNELRINYAEGCKIAKFIEEKEKQSHMVTIPLEEEENSIREAVRAAINSDVAIVCVGGMIKTSREAVFMNEDRGDRNTLNLLGNQGELIKRISQTGKPLIVVLMGGKPYAIPEVDQQADAILATFYSGEQAGVAVSDIIFGNVNPSGRLSVSFPRSVGQLPVYYSQKATAFYKDYLEGTSKPLYAFGHGLTYTSFEYRDLKIEKDKVEKDEAIRISLTLENTGKKAGSEVVQLYFSDKVASITRPEKLLIRFEKVFLEPGQEKRITFELLPEKDLGFTGIEYQHVVEPGKFEILVGSSSENILLKKEFTVNQS